MSKEEVYALYRDGDDQPKLVDSRVLFFDLLGIKEMSKGPNAVADLRRLRPTLARAIARAMTEDTAMNQASTWFTDNAVVAAPLIYPDLSEVLVGMAETSAAWLQVTCWQAGFLGRGAITFGPHYMDEGFVFGKALTEAVLIEQTTLWPRVTLSPSTIEMERAHSRFYGNSLSSEQSRALLRDDEGTVFVDCLGLVIDEVQEDGRILDSTLTDLHRATMDALANLPRSSRAWLKWRWMGDYQNYALKSRLSDPGPYLVSGDEGRVAFASFNDPRSDTLPDSAWYVMDRAPTYLLDQPDDPPVGAGPGVYAIYSTRRERLYVKSARGLHARVKQDLGNTPATARKSELCRRLGSPRLNSVVPSDPRMR
jgi:hypothetical protein